jgi:hypothetical protein
MSNLPDDVKASDPYWDNPDYNCEECGNPVGGEAYAKWAESIDTDEDGGMVADPMLCGECYCLEMGVCMECESELNQDLMCTCMGCDLFGRSQG